MNTSHEKTTGSAEWYTPSWIFEALKIPFDLDPCSPKTPLHWQPSRYRYTDNGLTREWYGVVWCNPPYGRETKKWLAKLASHGEGMALVFSRTDTDWFQSAVKAGATILLLKKRVKFVNAEGQESGSPGSGSCLIAFGERCKSRLKELKNLGVVIEERYTNVP
jgi:hypothetical protein